MELKVKGWVKGLKKKSSTKNNRLINYGILGQILIKKDIDKQNAMEDQRKNLISIKNSI
jgi:hypothetical protein